MRQIAEGCAMEKHQQQQSQQQQQQHSVEEGQEQADAVQRLEEHILANLLPVKVRLTRQLAAQRGASRNPATAPVQPGGGGGGGGMMVGVGGSGPTTTTSGGEIGGVGGGSITSSSIATTIPTTAKEGTFAAAAEAKRKAHERMVLMEAERRRLLSLGKSSGIDGGAAAAAATTGPSSFSSSSSSSAGGDATLLSTTSTVTASASSTANKRGVAPSYYGMPIGQQAGGSFLTSRLHGRVLGGGGAGTGGGGGGIDSSSSTSSRKKARTSAALADPSSSSSSYMTSGAAVSSSSAAGGESSTLSTPTTPLKQRRTVLYAGMAPGSNQVSSSINAVSGVHPGLIDEHTAQTATLVEKERLRLERMEECAARVALGTNSDDANNNNDNDAGVIEGGAVMRGNDDLGRHWPATKQSMVHQQQQHEYPQLAASSSDSIRPQQKPARQHIPLNFNDPSLEPSQQFELRLQEARWRQRKRRRNRRKRRLGLLPVTLPHNNGNGCINNTILAGNNNFSQQLRQAPTTATFPPQHFMASNANGVHKPGDSPTTGSLAIGTSSTFGPSVPGLGGGNLGGDISMKSCSNSKPIEYICAICNEHYPFNCGENMNPWWALSSHDCPKCGKTQIPRLDINLHANAIEYHPALLAHLDEGNTKIDTGDLVGIAEVTSSSYPPLDSSTTISANTPVMTTTTTTSLPMGLHATTAYKPSAIAVTTQSGMPYVTRGPINPALAAGIARDTSSYSDSDVSHTDESDGEGGSASVNGGLNYDESSDDEDVAIKGDNTMDGDADDDDSVAREESVEREEFGYEYKGEKMSDDQARRLLVLIEHASTCPGR